MAEHPSRYQCRALKSWDVGTEPGHPSRVQWRPSRGSIRLDEHRLQVGDGEFKLLRKWCKREFTDRQTDRTPFAKKVIEDPGSMKGLQSFGKFLEGHIDRVLLEDRTEDAPAPA
jgi:hypothetical protein